MSTHRLRSRQELIEGLLRVEQLTNGSPKELNNREKRQLYEDGDKAGRMIQSIIFECAECRFCTRDQLQAALQKSEQEFSPVAEELGTTVETFMRGSLEARAGKRTASPDRKTVVLSYCLLNIQARLIRCILQKNSGEQN